MTVDLEWGDPPTPRSPGYGIDWTEVVATLRLRRFEWAKVAETSTAKRAHDMKRNIEQGRYPSVPPANVEVAARTIHNGRGGVWMRWIGGDQS